MVLRPSPAAAVAVIIDRIVVAPAVRSSVDQHAVRPRCACEGCSVAVALNKSRPGTQSGSSPGGLTIRPARVDGERCR